jgi:hypothetical protein
VATVAAAIPAELASPDCQERARNAVVASPSEDVSVCGLDDAKDMSGAGIGHGKPAIVK